MPNLAASYYERTQGDNVPRGLTPGDNANDLIVYKLAQSLSTVKILFKSAHNSLSYHEYEQTGQ